MIGIDKKLGIYIRIIIFFVIDYCSYLCTRPLCKKNPKANSVHRLLHKELLKQRNYIFLNTQ